MYGTDWPLVRMRPYLKLLHELDFAPEALENIAWRTATRLFKIDPASLGRPRGPA
jgi:predicted TIM-barrel fold metal-dependent hydrolase